MAVIGRIESVLCFMAHAAMLASRRIHASRE
jgi:hypothetical protein